MLEQSAVRTVYNLGFILGEKICRQRHCKLCAFNLCEGWSSGAVSRYSATPRRLRLEVTNNPTVLHRTVHTAAPITAGRQYWSTRTTVQTSLTRYNGPLFNRVTNHLQSICVFWPLPVSLEKYKFYWNFPPNFRVLSSFASTSQKIYLLFRNMHTLAIQCQICQRNFEKSAILQIAISFSI